MFNWTNVKKTKDGDIILKKLSPGMITLSEKDNEEYIVSFLDLECNGLHSGTDEIIEVGIKQALVNSKGEITEFVKEISQLQEPLDELKKKVINITGLTKEKLKDQKVDWEAVKETLLESDYIVAHNASYDRNFIEAKIGETSAIWGCTMTQINWTEKGFSSFSLQNLCISHGIFYEGHRAINDIDATIYLMQQQSKNDKKTYLGQLLDKINNSQILVFANKHKANKKNILKDNMYYWSPDIFSWTKVLFDDSDLEKELLWLEEKIYEEDNESSYIKVDPEDNFKEHSKILDKYSKEIKSADRQNLITLVVHLPKKLKDLVKTRGYKYNPENPSWIRRGSKGVIKKEILFLKGLSKDLKKEEYSQIKIRVEK